MEVINKIKLIIKLLGKEGAVVVFFALILTLGVINFIWVVISPGDLIYKIILLFASILGGILIFIFTSYLILSIVMSWIINRKINRFFGPILKINEEHSRALKRRGKRGRRIKVE
ncbi:hypothetical protein DRN74_02290 [Candidatus Micrarchaeota archaeon]|nr:MAG: hypothetical protein DRN74_02290 [Candidatus Micrarchaeota archaeon]